ncbi:MAG: hypothetical protein PHO63_03225 [Bacilli bacterium]|nr:hypothetical protein [Bacilli bacterium]MDD4808599.1 hypothetical protein [Bacilli bacterium]
MDFIKRHKYEVIVFSVFIIIMILAFFGIKELIYPNSNKDLYGNRLDHIEDVVIKTDTISSIKDAMTETKKINSVNYNLQGRIMKFIIDVKKDTSLVDAESLSDLIIEKLTTEQQNYYEIQIYLVCNESEENDVYPVIGSRHKNGLTFVWTK